MIMWQFFPKSAQLPDHLERLVKEVFIINQNEIDSDKYCYKSDDVLRILCRYLEKLSYTVEKGKTANQKIRIPVLFGKNGILEKSFDADAYSNDLKTVVEIEAGRAYTNYQFLKDLFQACVMINVDYLVIAVRNIYRNSRDFDRIISFFDALFSSEKFKLPLMGVLIIGY